MGVEVQATVVGTNQRSRLHCGDPDSVPAPRVVRQAHVRAARVRA